LQINPELIETRAALLRTHAPELAEKLRRVYAAEREFNDEDVDGALYGGFLNDTDRRRCNEVRRSTPECLGQRRFDFNDPRLAELLFRYRARNWPETLTVDECGMWDAYRRKRLLDETANSSELTLPQYQAKIAALRIEHADDPAKRGLLDALDDWGHTLLSQTWIIGCTG